MQITLLDSNEHVLAELGRRIKSNRINASLTQEDLARRSGVSLSTVASIERGGDAHLGSYLSLLRALGMLTNVEALVPDRALRPSELAQLGHERKRVRPRKNEASKLEGWKWGDEQ
ncbi:MAG: helix-turn-helix domain-containing protein [Eggerthellaceae bacterium]|nr:helix-turn-helix domain-containing protein [Eggerthellaceae bacterium]